MELLTLAQREDIDTLIKRLVQLVGYPDGATYSIGANRITLKHCQQLFSDEMLSFVQMINNQVIISLKNLRVVINYLTELFPRYYPSPDLSRANLGTYLNQLAVEQDLGVYVSPTSRETITYLKLYGSVEELVKLSNNLPIPIKLITITTPDGQFSDKFIANSDEIYRELWERETQGAFARQLSAQFLNEATLPELSEMMGQYLVDDEAYTRFFGV